MAWWLLTPPFGVEGLWAAMIIYVIARAAALGRYYPRLNKQVG
jgi:Na+-driven multidrug efflux pump